MEFIKSENIRVFPCGGRNVNKDATARLTTEYNLVSIINRLVDQGSFVVTPSISISAPTTDFTFNIGGYLFTLDADGIKELCSDEELVEANGVGKKDACLVAYISPAITTVSGGNNVGTFQELALLGDTSSDTDYSAGILDVEVNAATKEQQFQGVRFQWQELTTSGITYSDLEEARYFSSTTTGYTKGTFDEERYYGIIKGNDKEVPPFYFPNTETQLVILQVANGVPAYVPPESKIRFETNRTGSNRSCRIDDGVL